MSDRQALLTSIDAAGVAGTQAIAKWGASVQIAIAVEECAELIVALQHNARGRTTNVVTEVADVLVMAMQLAHVFGEAKVAEEVERKISRLIGRLDGA